MSLNDMEKEERLEIYKKLLEKIRKAKVPNIAVQVESLKYLERKIEEIENEDGGEI